MLVRLDQLLPGGRAAVNREGTLLKVRAESPSEESFLEPLILSTISEMGYFAERLDESLDQSLRWFEANQVRELSEEEASVLSRRWVGELIDEELISDSLGDSTRSALYNGLLDLMSDAARTGTVGKFIMEPSTLASAAGLTLDQATHVGSWVRGKLGQQEPTNPEPS